MNRDECWSYIRNEPSHSHYYCDLPHGHAMTHRISIPDEFVGRDGEPICVTITWDDK